MKSTEMYQTQYMDIMSAYGSVMDSVTVQMYFLIMGQCRQIPIIIYYINYIFIPAVILLADINSIDLSCSKRFELSNVVN